MAGNAAYSHNLSVDPIVLVIIIAVGMPLGVVFALAKTAQLRGPAAPGRESRKRVESLVTEAIPEEHPEDDEDPDAGPEFRIDSEPPEPDPELRPDRER
ncbi:MAG: hypothetical protein QOJ29_2278 [Thermoleophilaceae bacterium]|nr:hypothetical protein [Thermoleophilaceae bacterium]